MPQNCSSCGAMVGGEAQFCTGCGAKLGKRTNLKARNLAIVAASTLVFALGATYYHLEAKPRRLIPLQIPYEARSKTPYDPRANNGDCALADDSGNVVALADSLQGISPDYGDWMAATSSKLNGNAGVEFIDSRGAIKIPPIRGNNEDSPNWRSTPFSTFGYAGMLEGHGVQNPIWGIIGRDGKYVSGRKFSNFIMANSNFAFFEDAGRWGVIDWAAFKPNPSSYSFSTQFDDVDWVPAGELQGVKIGSTWGIVDAYGKTVVNSGYEKVMGSYSSRYFAAMQSGKWGVFGIDGSVKISPRFDEAPLILSDGSHSFMVVPSPGKVEWFDENGNVLKSESLRITGVYPSRSGLLIIAREEYGPPEKGQFADLGGPATSRKERIVILDDRGRVDWTFPSLAKRDSWERDCVMKPVQD